MNILSSIQQEQREFHDRMGEYMHAISQGDSLLPALMLIAAGFIYGVLHAIGPGHGKIIISSYMMASKSTLRRAIALTAASSLMQAVVAIVLVLGLFHMMGLARAEAEAVANILEIASFSLITLLGLALMWRGVRETKKLLHLTGHQDHAHCSHSHAPSPEQLQQAHSPRAFILMIVSIGMRPCSGAIIVLFFACIVGVTWAGVLAALAMAVGTAISTAAFAILAMQSRGLALKFANSSEKALAAMHALFSLLGGLAVAATGAIFLLALLTTTPDTPTPHQHPLMMPMTQ